MRVLVTGGGGFIGSHVIRKLIASEEGGDRIALFDSFLNYVHPLDYRHIYNAKARLDDIQDRIDLIRGSTQDLDFLGRVVRDFRPSHIIHLAAMPVAKLAMEHPEEAANAILHGTMNLLQVARDTKQFQRFLYVSSSMVYGDFVRAPADEEHPTNPKEVYGGLKLSGEILTRVYGQLYGLDYTIVRPSAAYGPTDNNGRVLARFLDNALDGKPLEVRGAETSLDFTYVTDLADGIVLAAMSSAASGETFNLTRGEGRTLLEAAKIIEGLIPGTRIEVSEPEGKLPLRGTLDSTRARNKLGFDPQVSLEIGLKKYLAFLTKQKKALTF